MRCICEEGSTNASETACRDTRRRGFDSWLPRVNSVKMVASVISKNNETTRLETVNSVRRLFRKMFFRISFVNFIDAPILEVPMPIELDFERYELKNEKVRVESLRKGPWARNLRASRLELQRISSSSCDPRLDQNSLPGDSCVRFYCWCPDR